MKKALSIFLSFLVVVSLFSGCVGKPSFWESLNTVDYSKVKEYTSTLEILGVLSRALSIDDIVDENTYTHKENTESYAILKTKNNSGSAYYLFLLYNNDDGLIYDTIYADKFYNKELFETPSYYIGKTAEDFYELIGKDSDSSYTKEEIIFLNDNEYVYVQYDSNFKIIFAEKYNDDLKFYSILEKAKDFNISDLNA